MTIEQTNFSESIVAFQSASKGLDFLSGIANHPEKIPDIIFLDIKMPVMDGFGFLKEFEKLPEPVRKKSKIVMLSSSLDTNDLEQANSNPYVIMFIGKPLTVSSLEKIYLK
jgi:CheY-like chemotaxis protein